MLDEFLQRLPAGATEERSMVETAFGIPANFKRRAGEIRSDARLSNLAKVDDVKKAALGTFAAHLNQIRSRAAAMTADLTNLRKAMQPPAPDRADLYGQAERHKLLDRVLALPQAERFRLAMEDQAVMGAVLAHQHVLFSGLSAEQLSEVRDAFIERNFGPQLAGIEQREEIVETLNSALQVATMQFRNEAGLTEREYA